MMTASVPTPVPPPASTAAPLRYAHALSVTRGAWWRGLLAIVVYGVAFFVVSVVIGGIGLLVETANGGVTAEQLASGVIPLTPLVLLTTNLSLALTIPVAMLLQWAFFGVRPRMLSSVEGRFRWGWLGRLAVVIVPIWVVYVGVLFVFSPEGAFRFDGTVLAFVLVVLLTTPLQAAGEEYGLRGLVQRSVGSWFRGPRVAIVVSTIVSATLFGVIHFAGDPWLIAYYILFGAAMSIAAHATGGLEAPVLIHAVNNALIFLPAAFLGGLDEGIDRSMGAGGPFMLLPMAVVLLGAVVAWRWARRAGVTVAAVPPPPRYPRR